jgi:hypothetical protein
MVMDAVPAALTPRLSTALGEYSTLDCADVETSGEDHRTGRWSATRHHRGRLLRAMGGAKESRERIAIESYLRRTIVLPSVADGLVDNVSAVVSTVAVTATTVTLMLFALFADPETVIMSPTANATLIAVGERVLPTVIVFAAQLRVARAKCVRSV